MTYSIKIYDSKGTHIGDSFTATSEDIMKYINKGFIVKDNNGKTLSIEDVSQSIGVSDGFINVG